MLTCSSRTHSLRSAASGLAELGRPRHNRHNSLWMGRRTICPPQNDNASPARASVTDAKLTRLTLERVYFVGVDLAWGVRNPTGGAAIDSDGRLAFVGAVRDDSEVLAALHPYVQGDCLVGFDAPLVVANPTGQRPAETAFNRDFRRFEAGAHPANTARPEFADGPRGARLARTLGLDMDPLSSSTRRAIEV